MDPRVAVADLYWAGRLDDSLRYAQQQATEVADPGGGTSAVWLIANQARSLAALGRLAEAHAAIERAADARENVEPDELDDFGGLGTFTRPRQLYYAADALRWGGRDEAESTERLALFALDAYQEAQRPTTPSATRQAPDVPSLPPASNSGR
ncbi:MAG: hypothetical protein M3Z25_15065 [Actinomycetota bacterium]|nr:hypothetical protein [Actinomycetota bacterium]